MTTIVYRDGVMASDSQAQRAGWVLPGASQKIWRRPDGALLGLTGDYAEGLRLVRWCLEEEDPETQPTADSAVLRALPDGSVVIFEGGGRDDLGRPDFAVVGSGLPVALGALQMGAGAIRAVETACLHDPYSGGEVRWLRHHDTPPVPTPTPTPTPAALTTAQVGVLRDLRGLGAVWARTSVRLPRTPERGVLARQGLIASVATSKGRAGWWITPAGLERLP